MKRRLLVAFFGTALSAFAFAKLPVLRTIILGETEYVEIEEFLRDNSLELEKSEEAEGEFQLLDERHRFEFIVGGREAIVDGARYWLSFPPKVEEESIFLSKIDLETLVLPIIRPGTVLLERVDTIVLDPGHGGHDPGAKGEKGDEKDYALDMAERIAVILEERGLNVKLTRSEDVFVSLDDRPAVAASEENSVFVSLHLNSGPPTPTARGLEVFSMTPRGAPSTADRFNRMEVLRSWPANKNDNDGRSFLLAETVHRNVLSEHKLFDRGVKRARFMVLKKAEVPGILIEAGFLSNEEDADRVDNPEWRQGMAESIASGIVEYAQSANDGFELTRNTEEILENETVLLSR